MNITPIIAQSSQKFPHDVDSKEEMQAIFDERVVTATRVTRPLTGWREEVGALHHAGVKVITEKGNEYLIHKGNNFGIDSQTVVVFAKHMSNNWTAHETVHAEGKSTVRDFVNEGGKDYSFWNDNCQNAANREMEMARRNAETC